MLFQMSVPFCFQAINEKLDMSEKKLIEFASMPDIEEQLRDRMEALTQAQERQGTAEDRIQRLECQLVNSCFCYKILMKLIILFVIKS